MLLDFPNMPETAMEHFKNGDGTAYMRMYFDGLNRIAMGRLPQGASIGMHTHETNSEILLVVSGKARVVCDGREEVVLPGQAHYCPKGHIHATFNDEAEDLVIFTVVPEQ